MSLIWASDKIKSATEIVRKRRRCEWNKDTHYQSVFMRFVVVVAVVGALAMKTPIVRALAAVAFCWRRGDTKKKTTTTN